MITIIVWCLTQNHTIKLSDPFLPCCSIVYKVIPLSWWTAISLKDCVSTRFWQCSCVFSVVIMGFWEWFKSLKIIEADIWLVDIMFIQAESRKEHCQSLVSEVKHLAFWGFNMIILVLWIQFTKCVLCNLTMYICSFVWAFNKQWYDR